MEDTSYVCEPLRRVQQQRRRGDQPGNHADFSSLARPRTRDLFTRDVIHKRGEGVAKITLPRIRISLEARGRWRH